MFYIGSAFHAASLLHPCIFDRIEFSTTAFSVAPSPHIDYASVVFVTTHARLATLKILMRFDLISLSIRPCAEAL